MGERRYQAMRPASEWVWSQGITPTPIQVHEHDTSPRDTGLVDQHGVKIFSVPTRHPIGFLGRPSDA